LWYNNLIVTEKLSIIISFRNCFSILGFSVLLTGVSAQGKKDLPMLPDPYATKSTMNFSNVIGWKDGEIPYAPPGFKTEAYATGLENPRWIYQLPNGDVLVAESNSNHPFPEKVGAAIIGAAKSNSM